MRLELMTYALRKRRRDCVSQETPASCDDEDSSVAPEVAILTDDNGCIELMLPDDLSELIHLWPMLDEEMRPALLSIVRANTQSS